MVYNAVAEGRGADQAALGFIDIEIVIFSGLIGSGQQLLLQLEQIALQIKLKPCYRLAITLAAPRQTVSVVEIFKAADLRIQVLVRLHRLIGLKGCPKFVWATPLRGDGKKKTEAQKSVKQELNFLKGRHNGNRKSSCDGLDCSSRGTPHAS